MTPSAWAEGADGLLRAVLAEIERGDPDSRASIQAALDEGGRLQLQIDRPAESWRLRVRLIHSPDSEKRNRYIWESFARSVPWQPLSVVA